MKKFDITFLTSAFLFLLCLPVYSQNYNVQLQSTVQYPGETLANICGYWQDGREYALVGASKGMSIVDITNPATPVTIVQIPGPDNLWKEIKTYKNFAYVTSEGGQGCQIVDLSKLPAANLDFHHYDGGSLIPTAINTIHALHIDTTSGFMYLFGGDHNGATIHDLNVDPYNPTYAGEYQLGGYVHDGYADSDTLYACHIYDGLMTIVDMTDKTSPQVLGSVTTPNAFTHNAWLLPGRNQILTTDERNDSWLACYDISDQTDIKELDRLQCTPGSGSVVHNTHVSGHYAISSWYTDGFNIVDAWRPTNLVQTAWYDTWAGSGPGFDGCWGVYPFFPSGTIIASNIDNGELFVLTPTYIEACYVEGAVTNACNGTALKDVSITINHTDPLFDVMTDNNGKFATGQPTAGDFTVTVEKSGFITQTFDVTLAHHEIIDLQITLEPVSNNNLELTFLESASTNALAGLPAVIQANNGDVQYVTTDANGNVNIDCIESGDYAFGIWGYKNTPSLNVSGDLMESISLEKGYYDDFTIKYDWNTVNNNASTGDWVLDNPIATVNQNQIANPGTDSDKDFNDLCYLTGNGGGGAGEDDVDGGIVRLTSPSMDLTSFAVPSLTFDYWFYNAGGQGTPNDNFSVFVDNGQEEVMVYETTTSMSAWREAGPFNLADFITITPNMTVTFQTSDLNPGHLVEAAVDIFSVTEGSVGTKNLLTNVQYEVLNNPTVSEFTVRFDVPMDGALMVTNNLGQSVQTIQLSTKTGSQNLGATWTSGVYYVYFQAENGQRGEAVRLVKN